MRSTQIMMITRSKSLIFSLINTRLMLATTVFMPQCSSDWRWYYHSQVRCRSFRGTNVTINGGTLDRRMMGSRTAIKATSRLRWWYRCWNGQGDTDAPWLNGDHHGRRKPVLTPSTVSASLVRLPIRAGPSRLMAQTRTEITADGPGGGEPCAM